MTIKRRGALILTCAVVWLGCERQDAAAPASPPEAVNAAPEAPEAPPTEDSSPAEEPGGAKRPAGLDYSKLRIVTEPGPASTFHHELVGAGGEPVALPLEVSARVRDALMPALMLDRRVLVYDHGDEVYAYSLEAKKEHRLVGLHPGSDVRDYGWISPNGKRLALINRNPERERYGVKLFVLTIDDAGQLVHKFKKRLDPPPLIRCFSRCAVSQAAFVDDDTFRYLVRGGEEDPAHDDAEPVHEVVDVSR